MASFSGETLRLLGRCRRRSHRGRSRRWRRHRGVRLGLSGARRCGRGVVEVSVKQVASAEYEGDGEENGEHAPALVAGRPICHRAVRVALVGHSLVLQSFDY